MVKFRKWIKKYFIPHGENHYEPHFLRHESMLVVFLAIIVIELAFLVQVFIIFDKTNFLASVLPGVLTSLTNKQRAQNDASPLVESNLLTKAAQLKAEDMASKGYFAHTSPEGKTPWYWFEQVGYKYKTAGENLAVNFFESNDVAEAWMNSPTHRDNIVKKSYTEIGIGVAKGIYNGKSTIFVAQLFGTPVESAALPVPVQTLTNTPTTPTPTTVTPSTPTPKPIVKPTPKPAPAPTPKPTPSTPAPSPTPTEVAVTPATTEVLGDETITTINPKQLAVASSLKMALEKMLASPRQSVAFAYSTIAVITMFAILLMFFIASELRHPIIMMRGLGLVSVIIFLLFVNIKVISLETNIATADITASAIAN